MTRPLLPFDGGVKFEDFTRTDSSGMGLVKG